MEEHKTFTSGGVIHMPYCLRCHRPIRSGTYGDRCAKIIAEEAALFPDVKPHPRPERQAVEHPYKVKRVPLQIDMFRPPAINRDAPMILQHEAIEKLLGG